METVELIERRLGRKWAAISAARTTTNELLSELNSALAEFDDPNYSIVATPGNPCVRFASLPQVPIHRIGIASTGRFVAQSTMHRPCARISPYITSGGASKGLWMSALKRMPIEGVFRQFGEWQFSARGRGVISRR